MSDWGSDQCRDAVIQRCSEDVEIFWHPLAYGSACVLLGPERSMLGRWSKRSADSPGPFLVFFLFQILPSPLLVRGRNGVPLQMPTNCSLGPCDLTAPYFLCSGEVKEGGRSQASNGL